jgi:hypothetical protein
MANLHAPRLRSGVVIQLIDQQQAIEAAFRKLPIRRSARPGIPYESEISGIARDLMLIQRFDGQKKLRFVRFDSEKKVFV